MQESKSRFSFHRHPAFFFLLFCWFFAASFAWFQISPIKSLGEPPGIDRDDVFFDNIAFGLWKGEGIRLDFDNSEWREVYNEDMTDQNDWIFSISGVRGATTSRAPGYPLLLSYCYQFNGRSWTVPSLPIVNNACAKN